MVRHNKKNKDLPDNLYQNGRYFQYIHPHTKKVKSLNCTRKEAIAAAKAANIALTTKPDYSLNLLGTNNDIRTLIEGFKKEYMPIKGWKESTVKEVNIKLNLYSRKFGLFPIQQISVLVLKEFLSDFKPNAYIKHRQLWIHLFTYAISIGLIRFNEAEATLKINAPKRVRNRLSEGDYAAIYAVSDDWFKRVMELARMTLQRRGDLAKMQYKDIRDGYLYVEQGKSEGKQTANLKIKVWQELKELIRETKTVPLSPYVLHRHSKRRANIKQKLDNSVTPDYLSKTFAKYAKKAGIENVSFHEIRSLGARQYELAGYDKEFIQALLGHTTEQMTAVYLDDGKTKWNVVKI